MCFEINTEGYYILKTLPIYQEDIKITTLYGPNKIASTYIK